jgi:hypothetical protein
MLVVLDIVIEDENVGFMNLVKVAAPWDIGGLKDDALH